ncbi:MAG: tetratricopeptide repeat protein [Flavobacteriales bacterium]|nr:tetratricopeptide repeat protein [Flavobacteriales bacterium]MCB9167530.1 tetratricopeptide repeat protein [Flavobacteriales bacterium]
MPSPVDGHSRSSPIIRPILLLLLLAARPLFAGSPLDSLRQVVEGLPNDTSRLPVLTNMLRLTVFNRPDTALAICATYLEIAERSGDPVEIGKAHNYAGMCRSVQARPAKALNEYLLALRSFEQGDDPWYTAMAHNNVASIYKDEQRQADAMTEFMQALKGFRQVGDTVWMANVSNNMANIYYDEGRYDSAVYHYEDAIRILSGRGQDAFAAQVRMNLGNALYILGDLEGGLARMKEARDQHPLGEDESYRANILNALGHLEGLHGERDSALLHIRQGMRIAREVGAATALADGEEFLADIYEHWEQADSALVHYKRMKLQRDSLLNEERSAQIADMQVRYETERKDAELAENRAALEQRALTIRAVGAGALLALLAGLFAFRAYRIKRKGEAELARKNRVIEGQLKEKELLLKEIHHRVKNNLQVVSSLLSIQSRGITDEKAREAVQDSRQRVKSMALIHQDLYRDGDLTGVPMRNYVERLVNGLVASYGKQDHVRAVIDVQDLSLDVDTAVPLGLILNELITNALKYAWPDERPGSLTVVLKEQDDGLVLSVADDGVGMPAADAPAKGTGFGLNMVRTFSGKLKAEWTIEGPPGTRVVLRVASYKLAR